MMSGIYSVEGDTVKILYQTGRIRARNDTTSTATRPTSFDSAPVNSYLYTLKREKK